VAAQFALEHVDVLESQAANLVLERGRLIKALSAFAQLHIFDSSANFLLFRVPDATRIFTGLKQRGILIKCMHGSHALLDSCLRVTVGAAHENDAFLAALSEELSQQPNLF